MSSKFEKVQAYYGNGSGQWNIERVKNAVTANPPWITGEEYEQITGQAYEQEAE